LPRVTERPALADIDDGKGRQGCVHRKS